MQTLLSSQRYKGFRADRDKALEQIHINAQIDISRITNAMLSQIENISASAAIKAENQYMTTQISHEFEIAVRDIMTQFFPTFVKRILTLRKASYIMSYAGEQEAIGRATKRKGAGIGRGDFLHRLRDEMSAPTLLGNLDKRVWLSLMKLRHDIVQAFELAVTQELKPNEIVEKVVASFPNKKRYKRLPKALSKVYESKRDEEEKDDWFEFDFIDDGDWNMMVDAYKDTELPESRFDQDAVAEGGLMQYQWEMEQEATEDFVRSVRSGQVDGAKDLGVEEFVWIAIIDNKTCEYCCLPRNGKTTSEIEQMDDSDCDANVPPAHFNCRCDLGPVAFTDEVEGPDWSSFNEWLEN